MTTTPIQQALDALNFAKRCLGHEDNIAVIDKAIAALSQVAGEPAEPVSSIDYQQRRGAHADIVDEALAAYDQYMLCDSYDAQGTLDRIMKRMYERRALYASPQPADQQWSGKTSINSAYERAALEVEAFTYFGMPDDERGKINDIANAVRALKRGKS